MSRNYKIATEFSVVDRATAQLNKMSSAGSLVGSAWSKGIISRNYFFSKSMLEKKSSCLDEYVDIRWKRKPIMTIPAITGWWNLNRGMTRRIHTMYVTIAEAILCCLLLFRKASFSASESSLKVMDSLYGSLREFATEKGAA